jgi:hypothetical protein
MNKPELGGIAWRTSSYSSNGGSCVETGWHASTYSSNGGDCVEVSRASAVLVRDTKDRDGGTLEIPAPSWSALTTRLR